MYPILPFTAFPSVFNLKRKVERGLTQSCEGRCGRQILR